MGTHSGIKKALRKVFTREGWLAGRENPAYLPQLKLVY